MKESGSMSDYKQKMWSAFKFPVILSVLVTCSAFYYYDSIFSSVDSAAYKFIFLALLGLWFIGVPFGFRTLDYIMSKMATGTWIVSLFLIIVWWFFKLVVSLAFAPLFLVINIIVLLFQEKGLNKT